MSQRNTPSHPSIQPLSLMTPQEIHLAHYACTKVIFHLAEQCMCGDGYARKPELYYLTKEASYI
jgi:hypothetical protein